MRKCNFRLKHRYHMFPCFNCKDEDTPETEKPCSECTILLLESLEKTQLEEKIVELITKAGTKHPC